MIYSQYTSEDTRNKFTEIMLNNSNLFMNRIGGTEFDVANLYYNNKHKVLRNYNIHIDNLGKYSGYFDFTDNKQKNLINYLETLIHSYRNSICMTYANKNLIDLIDNGLLCEDNVEFVRSICKHKTLINYTFIEGIHLFLQSFKVWAEEKKILIVSPFSKSITYQYQRRNALFKDGYIFPNFELVLYNTNITYSDINDTKESLKINTNCWQEEYESIVNGITNLDFDIALLSCASYTGPLGNYISEVLKKKAIYFGGTINVMWNIYGERYANEYVNSIVNLDTQIDPIENKDIEHLTAGRHKEKESLRAYFGKRKQ